MSAPLKFEFKKDTGPISLAGLGPNPTAQFDVAFGSTQGSVIYRSASAWTALTPGSSGQFLTTNGAAANPSWGTGTGVLPSQTSNSGKLLTTDGTNAAWTTTGVLTSLTSPASTPLTLAGGSSGASLVLGQGTTAADITFTPKGTGEFKWTGSTFRQTAVSPDSTAYLIPGYATGTDPNAGSSRGVSVDLINLSATNENGTALTFSNSNQLSSGYIFGQNLSHAGRTGNIIFGTANGSAPNERARITSTGNLLIGTTSETGLTGAGGLKINSSTAGASNAGALVVAGGISAGAASYFGGSISFPSDTGIISSVNNGRLLLNGSANENGGSITLYGEAGAFPQQTIYTAATHVYKNIVGTPQLSLSLTAATFAGAVAIGNTTAASVAAPSTHKVSILIGGVQYYLLASNV